MLEKNQAYKSHLRGKLVNRRVKRKIRVLFARSSDQPEILLVNIKETFDLQKNPLHFIIITPK